MNMNLRRRSFEYFLVEIPPMKHHVSTYSLRLEESPCLKHVYRQSTFYSHAALEAGNNLGCLSCHVIFDLNHMSLAYGNII